MEMSSDAEAKAAITALNGSEMGGRSLTPMKRDRWTSVPVAAVAVAPPESAIADKRLTFIE